CFSMYPFVYDALGTVVYKNSSASWTCTTTKIVTATKKNFEGIRDAEVSERSIFINWSEPSKGVFSHFEVFYRKAANSSDSTFNFTSAVQATTVNYDFSEYGRV